MESEGGAPKFGSPKSGCTRDPKRRMMMRLYIFKGSFVTADTDAGPTQCAMNAAVWSRMPEELLWRVVQFVPAVKLFQWQLVSRQWREMLTSHDFRKELVATAAAARSRRGGAAGPGGPAGAAAQQSAVIARVRGTWSPAIHQNNGSSSEGEFKVVDIDLSFVPSWFWKSDCYSVITTMEDGLMCISNGGFHEDNRHPEDNQYCLMNPLTRTCKMLPKVPFVLDGFWASKQPVTITGTHVNDDHGADDWMLATLDLEGAGHWTLQVKWPGAHVPHGPRDNYRVEVCGGETFYYCSGDSYLLLISRADPDSAPLTLDTFPPQLNTGFMTIVAHRGSLFIVAEGDPSRWVPGPYLSCGIWRLVRSSMEWEEVALLEMEELHRLIRPKQGDEPSHNLVNAWAAGNQLCMEFYLTNMEGRYDLDLYIVVGFSLETGTWELLYDDNWRDFLAGEEFLELRADSFLL